MSINGMDEKLKTDLPFDVPLLFNPSDLMILFGHTFGFDTV
jgi:hypothetical protein